MDGVTARRLMFDEGTRNDLIDALKNAFVKRGYASGFSKDRINELALDEADIFLACIEGLAEELLRLQKQNPEKQERRRDRLLSIALNIEGAVDQMNAVDDAALEYAFLSGLSEAENSEDESNVSKQPFNFSFEERAAVSGIIKEIKPFLTAFAIGIRKAEKSLPQHAFNTSGQNLPWYATSKLLSIALALEDLFFKHNLRFTVSNQGLAANCLRAVYLHGGADIDRVDYWLKNARDHQDSMTSLAKRLKQQDK